MITVSFCVPVYNRVTRVGECIESLINQTAGNDEYEIIVVDDCSTDGTAQAVEAIFEKHGFTNGRVHVLAQNSGGASAPRNAAVALARGEYLFFVDSDDYVVPELVSKIRECASEFDSDLIYPRYRRETESGEVTSRPHAFARHGDVGKADVVRNEMLSAMSVLKAFRRSEWQRLGIAFDPALRTGEDILVVAKFLFNTDNHSVIADQDYYVIVDHEADRLTRRPTPRAGTFRNYGDILDIIYSGTLGDLEFKHRAAAKFIDRIMRVGAGAGNAYLAPGASIASQNEWKKLFSELFSVHTPPEIDAFLAPAFREKVRFLRAGDLVGARFAVAFHGIQQSDDELYSSLLQHVREAGRVAAATALTTAPGRTSGATETVSAASVAERQLRTEIGAMRDSMSWRATAPLRKTVRMAKRLRRAARRPRAAAAHVLELVGRGKGRVAVNLKDLRLDENGRPEAVLGFSRTKAVAVFATVMPAGHRDARHRLPLTNETPHGVVARLPVPADVGEWVVTLTVDDGQGSSPVRASRRRRVGSGELRVTATSKGVRVERLAPAVPWQPVQDEGDQR